MMVYIKVVDCQSDWMTALELCFQHYSIKYIFVADSERYRSECAKGDVYLCVAPVTSWEYLSEEMGLTDELFHSPGRVILAIYTQTGWIAKMGTAGLLSLLATHRLIWEHGGHVASADRRCDLVRRITIAVQYVPDGHKWHTSCDGCKMDGIGLDEAKGVRLDRYALYFRVNRQRVGSIEGVLCARCRRDLACTLVRGGQ